MDFNPGMNFEELVVPNTQESLLQTYPYNGMWGGWSMNSQMGMMASEEEYNRSTDFYGGWSMNGQMNMTANVEGESQCSMDFYGGSPLPDVGGFEQMDMMASEEESNRSTDFYGGWSMNGQMNMTASEEGESQWSMNFYGGSSLPDLGGFEQMDDIFSLMFEDVPRNDGDFHRASCSYNNVSSSSMNSGSEAPMFHFPAMSLMGEAPLMISELSSEELVLQDLQRAAAKLTDETRKCFRDSFYRLARNAQVMSDSVRTNSELQTSRYGYGDGIRLSREKEIESKKNSIDIVIADLTFNTIQ